MRNDFADRDIVLCPGNNIPNKGNFKTVAIAYDLTYKIMPQFHSNDNVRICNAYFEKLKTVDHIIAISESTKKDLI